MDNERCDGVVSSSTAEEAALETTTGGGCQAILGAEDWGVQLHETVLKQLEALGMYDGLDLVNLAGVEMMLRQAQLVEYAYAQDSAVGYSEVQAQERGKKGSGPPGARRTTAVAGSPWCTRPQCSPATTRTLGTI